MITGTALMFSHIGGRNIRSMLIGTVVLVGALTYVPALALGPVIEHLQLYAIH